MKNEELVQGLEKLLNHKDHASINSGTTISLKVVLGIMTFLLIAGLAYTTYIKELVNCVTAENNKLKIKVTEISDQNIKLSANYNAITLRVNNNYSYAANSKKDVLAAIKTSQENVIKILSVQLDAIKRRLVMLEGNKKLAMRSIK